MTNNSFGKSINTLSIDVFEVFLKGLFISEVCWAVGIFTIKYSILAFFWRVFETARPARIAINMLLAIVLGNCSSVFHPTLLVGSIS